MVLDKKTVLAGHIKSLPQRAHDSFYWLPETHVLQSSLSDDCVFLFCAIIGSLFGYHCSPYSIHSYLYSPVFNYALLTLPSHTTVHSFSIQFPHSSSPNRTSNPQETCSDISLPPKACAFPCTWTAPSFVTFVKQYCNQLYFYPLFPQTVSF